MEEESAEELDAICKNHRAAYALPPRPEGNYDCMSCDAESDCPLILWVVEDRMSFN